VKNVKLALQRSANALVFLSFLCTFACSNAQVGAPGGSSRATVGRDVYQPGSFSPRWTEILSPPLVTAGSIIAGPDKNLWFTDYSNNMVDRVTPTGVLTTFSLPTSEAGPANITSGQNSLMWFSESSHGIASIDTSGNIAEYPDPDSRWNHFHVTLGPDGNLWVTVVDNLNTPAVEKISPSGKYLATYLVPIANGDNWITSGPDGNLWITTSAEIGRLTTSGTFTNIGTINGTPHQIVSGPDGRIWFVWIGQNGDNIGAITTGGTITEYNVPACSARCGALGLTVGPDKKLWWTDEISQAIVNTTTAGVSKVILLPFNAQPSFIAKGPDGNLWFTANGSVDSYIRLVMRVAPNSLTFSNIGVSQTLTVSEKNYGGSWTATTSNPAVVTVASGTMSNQFVATSTGVGSGTITISDTRHNLFTVPVTVQ